MTTGANPHGPDAAPGYWTQAELLARGWTRGMIDELLTEPDLIKPHWEFRSQPPVRLFARARVQQAEQGARFREAR